jgi:flagellar basal-body rod protein FlgB
MINRLTGSLDFQTQALTLRAERQRLIASNIANADTPGYVARDFDFARALREAQGGSDGTVRSGFRLAENAALSRASGDVTASTLRAGEPPKLRYAAPSQTNLDGNSVDMDRERASFVDNALKYESTLRFINSSVKSTLDAMKSHHQG